MKIKEKRRELQLTQAMLSEQIGVGQSAVAMWEAGRSNPTLNNLKKMALIFKCSVDDLIEGGELNAAHDSQSLRCQNGE